jgi:DNA-binding MarR family transcriptional regulator
LPSIVGARILRFMNYSGSEGLRKADEEDAIEAGLELLPLIGASLFAGITHLGQTYRLTPAQVRVMLHLGHRERMTVGEIATALGVSMPAASELVDRLVEAGHLVRTTDPNDRRRVFITATPEARRIGTQLRELRRAQLRQALDHLSPEERPAFVRALRALVAGLNYGTEDAPACRPMAEPTAESTGIGGRSDIAEPAPAGSQPRESALGGSR